VPEAVEAEGEGLSCLIRGARDVRGGGGFGSLRLDPASGPGRNPSLSSSFPAESSVFTLTTPPGTWIQAKSGYLPGSRSIVPRLVLKGGATASCETPTLRADSSDMVLTSANSDKSAAAPPDASYAGIGQVPLTAQMSGGTELSVVVARDVPMEIATGNRLSVSEGEVAFAAAGLVAFRVDGKQAAPQSEVRDLTVHADKLSFGRLRLSKGAGAGTGAVFEVHGSGTVGSIRAGSAELLPTRLADLLDTPAEQRSIVGLAAALVLLVCGTAFKQSLEKAVEAWLFKPKARGQGSEKDRSGNGVE